MRGHRDLGCFVVTRFGFGRDGKLVTQRVERIFFRIGFDIAGVRFVATAAAHHKERTATDETEKRKASHAQRRK